MSSFLLSEEQRSAVRAARLLHLSVPAEDRCDTFGTEMTYTNVTMHAGPLLDAHIGQRLQRVKYPR